MLFRIGLRQKWVERISRLAPTQTRTQCAEEHDKAQHQELYESIAVGNALAEIEDDANRIWRG